MKWWLAASLFLVTLAGCQRHNTGYQGPASPPTFSIIIPRQCIKSIELMDDTICRGPDLMHLSCKPVRMMSAKGCEVLEVQHD